MMRRKRIPPVGLALFGLFFSGMAGFFIWNSVSNIARQARLIIHGTATQAEILHGSINEKRTGKKGTGWRYLPTVTYRFEVDGQQLQSDRVFAQDTSFRDRAEAEAVLAQYPPGNGTAYYDPSSPNESCLDRRVDFMPYLGVIFPLLHLSIGLMMILWAFRSGERPRAHLARVGVLLLGVTVILVTGVVHYLVIGGLLDLFASLVIGISLSVLLGCGWWWSWAYTHAPHYEWTPAS